MKLTHNYSIELDINPDNMFGYLTFTTIELAKHTYEILCAHGSYSKDVIGSSVMRRPTITLKEFVKDEDGIIQAERILSMHLLGNETEDLIELNDFEEIVFDRIGYFRIGGTL